MIVVFVKIANYCGTVSTNKKSQKSHSNFAITSNALCG